MAELNPIGVPAVTEPASALRPEAQNLARFNGHAPPKWNVLREQPWHRHAAHLFASCSLTCKEVADVLEKDSETVRNLLKQPWFQERVTDIMAKNGGVADVMALFKAEVFNSLLTLVEIRDEPKAPPAVRVASAREILDRGYGKAKQSIEVTGAPVSNDPVAEVKRLEEENKRMLQ